MSPSKLSAVSNTFLALGANVAGRWGSPPQSLARACRELAAQGLSITACSGVYLTQPLGLGRQPPYVNAVIAVRFLGPPFQLLGLIHRLERQAGRRFGRHWGPRALDIDILDFGGRRLGWPARQRHRGRLILPHPEMHRRAFVLIPLLEIAPAWRYPGRAERGSQLIRRLGAKDRGGVRQSLDFVVWPCQKDAHVRLRSGGLPPQDARLRG
jgi:2-amino-4-hydroxy-6-hydroxymethyldihydropteridine diphosphokinase